MLRDGALHDYTTEEDALPALRGSLRVRDQVTRRFGQLDTLECRFDEFHADVIENQLLRAGLAAAAGTAGDPSVRRHVRRLETVFADLCAEGPAETAFYRARLTYGRRNERYRRAHELCFLLFDHLGVDDLYGSGKTESFAFLLDMNKVFESFATKLITEAFRGSRWQVMPQRHVHSVIRDRRTGKRYSSIIPDLVLSDRDEQVAFDCKYKLYGENARKISSADIYQVFLYAYALSTGEGSQSRAGIIYPATETTTSPHLAISRIEGPTTATLTGIAIDLLGIQQSLNDETAWQEQLTQIRTTLDHVLDPAER